MKKKILAVMLSAVLAVTMLVGCGNSVETGGNVQNTPREDGASEEVRKETEDRESLFPDTIFDDIGLLDSTWADIEELFDRRGLAYDYAGYGLGTTIADEFCDWEADYLCGFTVPFDYIDIDNQTLTDDAEELTEQDLILAQWTTILYLDEDSEYRDAVKLVQSVIEQNKLVSYDYLEGSYQLYDLESDEVVCCPIKKLKYGGKNFLEYILLGKVPNYNKNDISHAIFFSVGVVSEESYQEGKMPDNMNFFDSVHIAPAFDPDDIQLPDTIQSMQSNTEEGISDNYWNIALFVTSDDRNILKGALNDCIIISINKDTQEIKLANMNLRTYLNIGDSYNRVVRVYYNGAEQAVEVLNTNCDMNITDFFSVGESTCIQFIDGLGGIWVDVDDDIKDAINQGREYYLNPSFSSTSVREQMENDCVPIETTGNQRLSGLQVMAWCCFTRADTITINSAVVEQMQNTASAVLVQLFDNLLRNNCYTNLKPERLDMFFEAFSNNGKYSIVDIADFPQSALPQEVFMAAKGWCVVPMDLEANVVWLHQFLFNQDDYSASDTVREIGAQILEDASKYMSE